MNDKERILTHIINELDITMCLVDNTTGLRESDFTDKWNGRVYTHFARYREPKKGEIVLCQTMNMNAWKIGWYVKRITGNEALIREIGTDRICRVYNEKFTPIVGLREWQTLEGGEYTFYQKVQKAFNRDRYWKYRFGGVDFDKENTRNATIWIREVFNGFDHNNPSKPFPVRIHWNKKTTIKSILETMKEQGYGTREFEKEKQDD